jgi:hypothetical protein
MLDLSQKEIKRKGTYGPAYDAKVFVFSLSSPAQFLVHSLCAGVKDKEKEWLIYRKVSIGQVINDPHFVCLAVQPFTGSCTIICGDKVTDVCLAA